MVAEVVYHGWALALAKEKGTEAPSLTPPTTNPRPLHPSGWQYP